MTEPEAVAAIRRMVEQAPGSSWIVEPDVLAGVIAHIDALERGTQGGGSNPAEEL